MLEQYTSPVKKQKYSHKDVSQYIIMTIEVMCSSNTIPNTTISGILG
ncbi:unnamed protein product [Camellia sinensis]